MKKLKLATVWLDGCSRCHMSLLDLDTAIIALVRKVDIVYETAGRRRRISRRGRCHPGGGRGQHPGGCGQVAAHPATHQSAGFARRLRRDRQRFRTAERRSGSRKFFCSASMSRMRTKWMHTEPGASATGEVRPPSAGFRES